MLARREFVASLLATTALSACGGSLLPSKALYLSASSDSQGRHYATAINSGGCLHGRVQIPLRAHQALMAPDGRYALYIARRPGNQLYIVDWLQRRLVKTIAAMPQHHFFGHALFSADGQYLYTTENRYLKGDIYSAEGVIVVRNATTFNVVDSFPSGGLGPHQMAWLSDGSLVVANGGIQTHPSAPRKKLNISSMASTLSYLREGEIYQQHTVASPYASLRHLAVTNNDTVIVGAQQQAAVSESIIYVASRQQGLQPVVMDSALLAKTQQYAASVCAHPHFDTAVITSPRGGLAMFIDTTAAVLMNVQHLNDAAGACVDSQSGDYWLSQGQGQIHRYGYKGRYKGLVEQVADVKWDNHLSA